MFLPQHCLSFLPDPHGQGAFLPVLPKSIGVRLGKSILTLLLSLREMPPAVATAWPIFLSVIGASSDSYC
jgi:hypothetical protein